MNNFRIPSPNSGILLGADELTSADDILAIAKSLKERGNKLYVSSRQKDRFEHLGLDGVIDISSDRRLMSENLSNISMVIQIAKSKPLDTNDENYLMRRVAVDLGIPLINNEKVAQLFLSSLKSVEMKYGKVSGIKSWDEFVDSSPKALAQNA